MWTLANHPARAGADPQARFARWGMAKDEFVDRRRLAAPALRPRGPADGQRLRDDRSTTARAGRWPRTPSGLAAYGMDSHNVQRYVDADGPRPQRGRRAGRRVRALSDQLPRRSCPRPAECDEPAGAGLPVGRRTSPTARSAWSRCSWSSASRPPRPRARPSTTGVAVQAVDYPKLRQRLLADKQVLAWTGRTSKAAK